MGRDNDYLYKLSYKEKMEHMQKIGLGKIPVTGSDRIEGIFFTPPSYFHPKIEFGLSFKKDANRTMQELLLPTSWELTRDNIYKVLGYYPELHEVEKQLCSALYYCAKLIFACDNSRGGELWQKEVNEGEEVRREEKAKREKEGKSLSFLSPTSSRASPDLQNDLHGRSIPVNSPRIKEVSFHKGFKSDGILGFDFNIRFTDKYRHNLSLQELMALPISGWSLTEDNIKQVIHKYHELNTVDVKEQLINVFNEAKKLDESKQKSIWDEWKKNMIQKKLLKGMGQEP